MHPFHARCRFIMMQPSHPGNVGSAARALKTMGFLDLVLVKPRFPDVLTHPDAIALASGALDVLQNAQIVETLEEALAPVTLAFALTARPRDLGPLVVDARQAARVGFTHLTEHDEARIAVVLGTESRGLGNEDIALCHRICHIPANPEYSSLNVSQALQLLAWELHYALDEAGLQPVVTRQNAQYATSEELEGFMKHWEEALIYTHYLKPKAPKKLMPRMRYLFTKVQLSREEVSMLRGVCTSILDMPKK